ncbi:protein of unknown function [Catalinimonas alkaloidigena]|uniref:DUF4386 domain-containing protein n=1 Tax=Catalinimonas alkaloidigena TaxID=1075417 RepID=A0A1G9R4A8_9BACT|nr:DUF4386 domain-containing protein [Catalinimonas alkaloidigena]SDM18068.1 protein of unknown function [Catalinimonas alkaloidigena]
MDSPNKTARLAGLLYLLMGFAGMFGLMYVPSQLIVSGDAAATTANILQAEGLYRAGIVANLLCQTLFIFLVLALYRLLRPVHESYARLMLVLVIVAVPIAFLNLVNQLAVLVLLSEVEFLAAFDPAQLQALAMVFLRLYHYGIVVVEVFWGLWLFPFGLLVYHSGFLPRLLGILLMIACFGYLANSVTELLFPTFQKFVSPITSVTGTVGEFSIILWLLIKGVNEKTQSVAAQAA